MMVAQPTNSTDRPVIADRTSAQVATGNSSLDYGAFMQLLIAQMKNQDPMEPMKSSDYVAQLATFSQVAKTTEMNDQVTALLIAARFQQAEGIIGKTVTSSDGRFSGLVTGSKIVGNDVIAILQDGREVALGPGVTISSGTSRLPRAVE